MFCANVLCDLSLYSIYCFWCRSFKSYFQNLLSKIYSTIFPDSADTTAWSPWSECSQSCNGVRSRKRFCALTSDNHCASNRFETESCNTDVLCPGQFLFLWLNCKQIIWSILKLMGFENLWYDFHGTWICIHGNTGLIFSIFHEGTRKHFHGVVTILC